MSFVEGMKDREDKFKVIHDKPATLKDVYTTVHEIRRVKVLTRETKDDPKGGKRRDKSGKTAQRFLKKQFKKLEGKAKQKAWDEGACLNCGAKDHFIAQCPTLKTSIKAAVKKYAKLFFKTQDPKKSKKPFSDKATAGSGKKLHKLQNPTGTQKEEDQEEDSPESESVSELSETNSEADLSAQLEEESGDGEAENSRSESEG